MDNIFLLKSIHNTIRIDELKQVNEGKCGEGKCGSMSSENEEATSTLSSEEVENLADFAYQDLSDSGMESDLDTVTDKIGEFLEDIPGLEDAIEQQKAVRAVVDVYRKKYMV